MGVPIGDATGDHVVVLYCEECSTRFETDETMQNTCPDCGLVSADVRAGSNTDPTMSWRRDGDGDGDATGFGTGDWVVDSHADDPDRMLVLDGDAGQADEVVADPDGTTVADYGDNTQYPSDDTVVDAVYEADLDASSADWRDWPRDEIPERLDANNAAVTAYSYPMQRLQPAGDADD